MPKCSIKADYSFEPDFLVESTTRAHTPFDEIHILMAGKTHSGVRYFAKKHLMLPASLIIERLKTIYPMLAKFFVPEVRKVNAIAARERKILHKMCPDEDAMMIPDNDKSLLGRKKG